jgi:hypothetical protein
MCKWTQAVEPNKKKETMGPSSIQHRQAGQGDTEPPNLRPPRAAGGRKEKGRAKPAKAVGYARGCTWEQGAPFHVSRVQCHGGANELLHRLFIKVRIAGRLQRETTLTLESLGSGVNTP